MNKIVFRIFSVVLSAMLVTGMIALPAMAVDQDLTDKYPSTGPTPEQQEKKIKDPVEEILKRFEFNGFADLQQGYDNNADLDSQRHKDGFLQGSFAGELAYKQTEELKFKAGLDVFETIYYKYNINNILDVSPYIGFDYEITPDMTWRNRCIYDYFSYPNRKESSFSGIVLSTYLRHFILRDIYHEAGVEYLKRWYPDRKISIASGAGSHLDRIDDRYRVKYNVGMYGKQFYLRVSNEFANNESNDEYQDYYDYWLYRLRPAIMIFITDKLYTDLSFIYKYTHYKDRRSTDGVDKVVRDHTYIGTAAMYYDISRSVTFGITYSYSENLSNDPFQRYSGSILTGGVYYNF